MDRNPSGTGLILPKGMQAQVSDKVAIRMNRWYGQFHVLRDIDLTV